MKRGRGNFKDTPLVDSFGVVIKVDDEPVKRRSYEIIDSNGNVMKIDRNLMTMNALNTDINRESYLKGYTLFRDKYKDKNKTIPLT